MRILIRKRDITVVHWDTVKLPPIETFNRPRGD